MISRLLYKINIILSIILVLFVFGLIILQSSIEIQDMDIWLHLATGRHILENFSIPKVDIFSSTMAGTPWMNHEWLFQVIVAALVNIFGMEGLRYLQMGIVFILFAVLLLFGIKNENKIFYVFVLLITALACQFRFSHRPDLFSMLFLVLYFWILALSLKSRKTMMSLFLIQTVWVNMHGFFILGPCLVLLAIFTEFLKRNVKLPFEWNRVNRLENREYANLKTIFFIVFLACFLNPSFVKGVFYPLKVLFSMPRESEFLFKYVQELKPPISFHSIFSVDRFFSYKLLIFISFAGFVCNYKKIDIGLGVMWVLFLFFSLRGMRNIPYFSIIAYITIIINLNQSDLKTILSRYFLFSSKIFNVAGMALKLLLIIFVAQMISRKVLNGYIDFDTLKRKSLYTGVSLRNYPSKAVDFLVQNKVKGKFYNDFNSGAFLLGKTFPAVKVFVDGRTEFYGNRYLNDYLEINKGNYQLFEHYSQRYNLTGVFISYVYDSAPMPLLKYLNENSQWTLVYFDFDAAIFLKNIPQNSLWINHYKIDLQKWTSPSVDIKKYGVRRITPYRFFYRAKALYSFGYYEKAKEEIEKLLKIDPFYPYAYKWLAKIYLSQKKFDQAYAQARIAGVIFPENTEIHYLLGRTLFEMGDIPGAKKQDEKCLHSKKDIPECQLLRSLINAKEGKWSSALENFKRIQELRLQHVEMLLTLLNLFYNQKEYVAAYDICSKVRSLDPLNNQVARQCEVILKKGGNNEID